MTSTQWSPSQGFWETGEMTFIPGEQGKKGQILSGTGYKGNIGEHGT